jgi:hypothetical protein
VKNWKEFADDPEWKKVAAESETALNLRLIEMKSKCPLVRAAAAAHSIFTPHTARFWIQRGTLAPRLLLFTGGNCGSVFAVFGVPSPSISDSLADRNGHFPTYNRFRAVVGNCSTSVCRLITRNGVVPATEVAATSNSSTNRH